VAEVAKEEDLMVRDCAGVLVFVTVLVVNASALLPERKDADESELCVRVREEVPVLAWVFVMDTVTVLVTVPTGHEGFNARVRLTDVE